jgi:hypothetical protein
MIKRCPVWMMARIGIPLRLDAAQMAAPAVALEDERIHHRLILATVAQCTLPMAVWMACRARIASLRQWMLHSTTARIATDGEPPT